MSTTSYQQHPDDSTRILLVEDNPGDVRLLQEAFKTAEAKTSLSIVNTGEDAIDFLKQQGEYEQADLPDIVLLDLDLPQKGGCEVLEIIRDESPLQGLPVLMLTVSSDNEDIARCYEADANAYLTKPTDPTEFSEIVKAIEEFWLQRVRLPPIIQ